MPTAPYMKTMMPNEARHQYQDPEEGYEVWNGNPNRKNLDDKMVKQEHQKVHLNHDQSRGFPLHLSQQDQYTRKDQEIREQQLQNVQAQDVDAFELENSIESVSKNNPYQVSILDLKYESKAIVQTLGCVLQTLVDSNAEVQNFSVTKFHASRPPSISVQDYLQRINRYSSCSQEVFILALIYIDKLIKESTICLNNLNVHRILITAVMLAAKFFDDQYYNNAYYAKVGGVPREEMNALEIEFLFAIRFSLRVDPKTFNKYQSELTNHAVKQCNNCNKVLRNHPAETPANGANVIPPVPENNGSQLMVTVPYNQEENLSEYMRSDSTVIETNSIASYRQHTESNDTVAYNTMTNVSTTAISGLRGEIGLPRRTNSSGTLVDQYVVENNAFVRCDSYASTNSGYYDVGVFDREKSNYMFTSVMEEVDRPMMPDGIYDHSDEQMSAKTNSSNGNILQQPNINILNSNHGHPSNYFKYFFKSTSSNSSGGLCQTDSTSSSLTPSPSSMTSWSPENGRSDTPSTRTYLNMPSGPYRLVQSQSDASKERQSRNEQQKEIQQFNIFQQDPQLFLHPELLTQDKYTHTQGQQMMSTPIPSLGLGEYVVVSKEQADNSFGTKNNSMYFEQSKWINRSFYQSNQRENGI